MSMIFEMDGFDIETSKHAPKLTASLEAGKPKGGTNEDFQGNEWWFGGGGGLYW
jgi:hypothetical protein